MAAKSEKRNEKFRCRLCRFTLFETSHLSLTHILSDQCSSWFLRDDEEMLPWVKNLVDDAGWTEGKLYCPKCNGRVGGFDFLHVVPCSCGNDVIPAIWCPKSKIDHVKKVIEDQDIKKIKHEKDKKVTEDNDAGHGDDVARNTTNESDVGNYNGQDKENGKYLTKEATSSPMISQCHAHCTQICCHSHFCCHSCTDRFKLIRCTDSLHPNTRDQIIDGLNACSRNPQSFGDCKKDLQAVNYDLGMRGHLESLDQGRRHPSNFHLNAREHQAGNWNSGTREQLGRQQPGRRHPANFHEGARDQQEESYHLGPRHPPSFHQGTRDGKEDSYHQHIDSYNVSTENQHGNSHHVNTRGDDSFHQGTGQLYTQSSAANQDSDNDPSCEETETNEAFANIHQDLEEMRKEVIHLAGTRDHDRKSKNRSRRKQHNPRRRGKGNWQNEPFFLENSRRGFQFLPEERIQSSPPLSRASENHAKDQETLELSDSEIPDCYKCAVCLSLLFEPFKTPCGHVFCGLCLRHLNFVTSGRPKCPLCREPLWKVESEKDMEQEIKETFPANYRKRAREERRNRHRKSPLPSSSSTRFHSLHDRNNQSIFMALINHISIAAMIISVVINSIIVNFNRFDPAVRRNLVRKVVYLVIAAIGCVAMTVTCICLMIFAVDFFKIALFIVVSYVGLSRLILRTMAD